MKPKEQILQEYKRIFEIREMRDKLIWKEGRSFTFREAEKYLEKQERERRQCEN